MEKKDERILKKVGKLLSMYGVTEEEKQKFLADLQDKKYDDQEELNEGDANEAVEPTEESMGGEEAEPMEDTAPVEGGEEPMEEAPMGEEPADDMVEEDVGETPDQAPVEEAPVEEIPEPMEEQPQPVEPTPEPMGMEQPAAEPNANEETQKTIDGLVARIESLEDIIKKLGVQVDSGFGTSPTNESNEVAEESEFDRINRLRRGN